MRIVAINTVENRHTVLQPTLKKYRSNDVCNFKAKDKKVVGLYLDGLVIVWALSSGSILYQFNAFQFEFGRNFRPSEKSGFIQSFDSARDKMIVSHRVNDGLMVWSKTIQPNRFCDTKIELVYGLHSYIHDLPIWFGQVARTEYGDGPSCFKFKSLEDQEERASPEIDCNYYMLHNSPTLLVTAKNCVTKVFDLLGIEKFLDD